MNAGLWMKSKFNDFLIDKVATEISKHNPMVPIDLIKAFLKRHTDAEIQREARIEVSNRSPLLSSTFSIFNPDHPSSKLFGMDKLIHATPKWMQDGLLNRFVYPVENLNRNFNAEVSRFLGLLTNSDMKNTIDYLKVKDFQPFLYQGKVDYKAEVKREIKDKIYLDISKTLGKEWNVDPESLSALWKHLDKEKEQNKLDEKRKNENLQVAVQVAMVVALQVIPGIGQFVASQFATGSLGTNLILAGTGGAINAGIASAQGDANTTTTAFLNTALLLSYKTEILKTIAFNSNYTNKPKASTLGGNIDLLTNQYIYGIKPKSGYGGGFTVGGSALNIGLNYGANSGYELTIGGTDKLLNNLPKNSFYNLSYQFDSGHTNLNYGIGQEYGTNFGINMSTDPNSSPSFFLGYGCDAGSKDGECSNRLLNSDSGLGMGGSVNISLDGNISLGVDFLQNELATYNYNMHTKESSWELNSNWNYEYTQMIAQNNVDELQERTQELLAVGKANPADVNLGNLTMLLLSLGFGLRFASRSFQDVEIKKDSLKENKDRIKEGLLQGEDINSLLSNEFSSISDKENQKELKNYAYNLTDASLESIFYGKGSVFAKEYIHSLEESGNWNITEIQTLYDRIHNLDALEEAKKYAGNIQQTIEENPDNPELAFIQVETILADKNLSEMTSISLQSILTGLLTKRAMQIFRENKLETALQFIEKIQNRKDAQSQEISKQILFTIAKEKILSINAKNMLEEFKQIKENNKFSSITPELEKIVIEQKINELRYYVQNNETEKIEKLFLELNSEKYSGVFSSNLIQELEMMKEFFAANFTQNQDKVYVSYERYMSDYETFLANSGLNSKITSSAVENLIYKELKIQSGIEIENKPKNPLIENLLNTKDEFSRVLKETKDKIAAEYKDQISIKDELLLQADRIGMDKQIQAIVTSTNPWKKFQEVINANNSAGNPLSEFQIQQIYLESKLKKANSYTEIQNAYQKYRSDLEAHKMNSYITQEGASEIIANKYEKYFLDKISKSKGSSEIISAYNEFRKFLNGKPELESRFSPEIHKEILTNRINEELMKSAMLYGKNSPEMKKLFQSIASFKLTLFGENDLQEFKKNSDQFINIKLLKDIELKLQRTSNLKDLVKLNKEMNLLCSGNSELLLYSESVIEKRIARILAEKLKPGKPETDLHTNWNQLEKLLGSDSEFTSIPLLENLRRYKEELLQKHRLNNLLGSLDKSIILNNFHAVDMSKSEESGNQFFQIWEASMNQIEGSLNSASKEQLLAGTERLVLGLSSKYLKNEESANKFFYSIQRKLEVWNIEHPQKQIDIIEMQKQFETSKLVYKLEKSKDAGEAIEKYNEFIMQEKKIDKAKLDVAFVRRGEEILANIYKEIDSTDRIERLETEFAKLSDNELFQNNSFLKKWNSSLEYIRARKEILSEYVYSGEVSKILTSDPKYKKEMENTPARIHQIASEIVELRYKEFSDNHRKFVLERQKNLAMEIQAIEVAYQAKESERNSILNQDKQNIQKIIQNTIFNSSDFVFNTDLAMSFGKELQKDIGNMFTTSKSSTDFFNSIDFLDNSVLDDKTKLQIQTIAQSISSVEEKDKAIVNLLFQKLQNEIHSLSKNSIWQSYHLPVNSEAYKALAVRLLLTEKIQDSIQKFSLSDKAARDKKIQSIKSNYDLREKQTLNEGFNLGMSTNATEKNAKKTALIEKEKDRLQMEHEYRRNDLIVEIGVQKKLEEMSPKLQEIFAIKEKELQAEKDSGYQKILDAEAKLLEEKSQLETEKKYLENSIAELSTENHQDKFYADKEKLKQEKEDLLNKNLIILKANETKIDSLEAERKDYLVKKLTSDQNEVILLYNKWNSLILNKDFKPARSVTEFEARQIMLEERKLLTKNLNSLGFKITSDFKLKNVDGSNIPENEMIKALTKLTDSVGGLENSADLAKLWVVNTQRLNTVTNQYDVQIGDLHITMANNASNTPDKIIGLEGNTGTNGKIWQVTALAMKKAKLESIHIGHVDYGGNSHINGTSFDIWKITPQGKSPIACTMSTGRDCPPEVAAFDNAFMSQLGSGKAWGPWRMWDDKAKLFRENNVWKWKDTNAWQQITNAGAGDGPKEVKADQLFGLQYQMEGYAYTPGMDYGHHHHLHYDVPVHYKEFNKWTPV